MGRQSKKVKAIYERQSSLSVDAQRGLSRVMKKRKKSQKRLRFARPDVGYDQKESENGRVRMWLVWFVVANVVAGTVAGVVKEGQGVCFGIVKQSDR